MGSKKKLKAGRKQDARNQKWKKEDAQLHDFQRKAPEKKAELKRRGIVAPFFDYLDSYPEEFQRIANYAKAMYPSLLGVHEVESEVFDNLESHWADFGYEHLQQIFFGIDQSVSDYGTKRLNANLNGVAISFREPDGTIRTAIFICKSVQSDIVHSHYKYVLKIPALCHEIGHVHDVEHGTNFNFDVPRLNIIDAEIFAHLFAFDLMAKRNLKCSFDMLYDALKDAQSDNGYLGRVARGVVEKVPAYSFVDWQQSNTGA